MTYDPSVNWTGGETAGALVSALVLGLGGLAVALNFGGVSDAWYWSVVRWASRRGRWARGQYRGLSVPALRSMGAAWACGGVALCGGGLAQVGHSAVHRCGHGA